MDEQLTNQFATVTERLAAAAEALENALARLQSDQAELAGKVDRIVAAVDERASEDIRAAKERAAALERENQELKAQAVAAGRKTLSPLVSTLLSKNGVDDTQRFEADVLDKALSSLSMEQRIAVKAEMARAGLIG